MPTRYVTQESALEAIDHLAASNTGSREQEAVAMLVPAALSAAAPAAPADQLRVGGLDDLAELALLNQLIELGAKASYANAKASSDDGQAGTVAYVQWQELRAEMGALLRKAYAAPTAPQAGAPAHLTEAKALAAEGKRVEALKLYRAATGCSLDEARETLYPREVQSQAGAPAYGCCNSWFVSLPEGRQAVLRDDKWMLAHAAFEAGRAARAGAQAVPSEKWHSMDSAPKDGTLVRLLVEFEHHATEDGEGPQPTIGSNTWDNHHDFDEWQFAGWNWEQDCYTQGIGTPVGWLPMIAAPAAVSAPSGFVHIDPEDFREIIRDIGQHIEQGAASERKVAAERPSYGTGMCVHIANQMAKMLRLLAAAPQAPAGDQGMAMDAARYRWLRDVSVPPHNFYLSVPVEFDGVKYSKTEVDAYIDRALTAKSQEGGA